MISPQMSLLDRLAYIHVAASGALVLRLFIDSDSVVPSIVLSLSRVFLADVVQL